MSALNLYHLLKESQRFYAGGWASIYQAIQEDFDRSISENPLSTEIANSRRNCFRNRYFNILPYDTNRVKITAGGDNLDGYINASPVNVPEINRKYILCQGPLDSTAADFWQMIWEQNVPLIVMLNNLIENGAKKCCAYYPTAERKNLSMGDWKIQMDEEISHDIFVHRKLTLKNIMGETKTVHHIHYSEWADFGIPPSSKSFLLMLKYVKDLKLLSETPEDPPSVIHCSAGVGRSGTFIFIDSIVRMIETDFILTQKIVGFITSLRRQRFGLIQNHQQLEFTWTAILDYLEENCSEKIHGKKEKKEEEKPASKEIIYTEVEVEGPTTTNDDEVDEKNKALPENKITPLWPRRRSISCENPEEKRLLTKEKEDEVHVKRREKINRMVEMSREEELRRRSWHKNMVKLCLKLTCSVGTAAAVVFAAYYFARS